MSSPASIAPMLARCGSAADASTAGALIGEEFALLLRLAFVLAVHVGPYFNRRLPRACPFTANQHEDGREIGQATAMAPIDGLAPTGATRKSCEFGKAGYLNYIKK